MKSAARKSPSEDAAVEGDILDDILDVGVVVIGRNEGDRLMLCLDSLERASVPRSQLVYVDSGSSDGSVERVRARGIDAIAIEAPFTAAKGRNAGFAHLTQKHPKLLAMQFVDGDCEYFPAWIDVASDVLRKDPGIVAVTGVQHERRPEATVYNLLCDVEWTGVVGDLDTFAGNVMVRVDALHKSGLYNPDLIAGEDPELSIRVKKTSGGRIVRIDEPICLHDVDMTKASQWWKRNVRAGHAYAQVSDMHGEPPRRFWKKETRSNWIWVQRCRSPRRRWCRRRSRTCSGASTKTPAAAASTPTAPASTPSSPPSAKSRRRWARRNSGSTNCAA